MLNDCAFAGRLVRDPELRRAKAWKRNREYTDKHQAALEKSREKKLIREKEERYGN